MDFDKEIFRKWREKFTDDYAFHAMLKKVARDYMDKHPEYNIMKLTKTH